MLTKGQLNDLHPVELSLGLVGQTVLIQTSVIDTDGGGVVPNSSNVYSGVLEAYKLESREVCFYIHAMPSFKSYNQYEIYEIFLLGEHMAFNKEGCTACFHKYSMHTGSLIQGWTCSFPGCTCRLVGTDTGRDN